MNNSRNTVSALFISTFSILLCFSMFIGSTFAWFYGTAANRSNAISVGNLDITLFNEDEEEIEDKSILFENITWKPGTVAYENLTVQNNGSLAFDYAISLAVTGYNTVSVTTGAVEGGEPATVTKSLQDVIKVAFVEEHIELSSDNIEESAKAAEVLAVVESSGINMHETQEDQAEATKWASVGDYHYKGKINATHADATESDAKNIAVVIYWEPCGEGSIYSDSDFNSAVNTTSDGTPLYINLGLQFKATQAEVETDSLGNTYDAEAAYESEVNDSNEEANSGENI